ncbi:MAG TPA: hypothetical protein VKP69_12950 [Isosphaeraceae bacterium]|nr:hypothetical protein [Isosphaeraceae bacterium]
MMTGPPPKLALLLASAGLLSGCAQSGPLLSRGTTLGTLKTSVSHLEFENSQLRRELSKAKSESREFEDRLVQEERTNDDLKSRLDDARNLLSQRGYDLGGSSSPSGLDPGSGDPPPAQTLPAGRSSRKRRKPPFVQIPGRIDTVPPSDAKKGTADDLFEQPSTPSRDEFGPQGRRDDLERWLPVAQGMGDEPPKKVR